MSGTRLILWVAAAVAAIAVTTAAVTVANATGGRDNILSQDEVSQQLREHTQTPTAPGTPTTPGTPDATSPAPAAPGVDGVTRTLQGQAATVVARCTGTTVFLEAWTPKPGYRVDEVVRGPAQQGYVWIESDTFEDVELFIRCEAGEPTLTERVEEDDHGGRRDRDDRD